MTELYQCSSPHRNSLLKHNSHNLKFICQYLLMVLKEHDYYLYNEFNQEQHKYEFSLKNSKLT